MRTQLVRSTDPILRIKAKPITEFGGKNSAKISALIVGMYGLMRRQNGIGIAAPQVGRSVRLIIVSAPSDTFQTPKNLFMCNPEIVARSKEMVDSVEGCLSLPGKYFLVKRHKVISVKYQDVKGDWQVATGDGMFAVVAAHEIDHINGILMSDVGVPA